MLKFFGFPAYAGINLNVLVQLTARVIEVNADFLVREAMSSDSSGIGSSAYSPEVLN